MIIPSTKSSTSAKSFLKVNSFIFMGLDIVEATSGMGMHLKDIPPHILVRQLKVGNTFLNFIKLQF